MAVNGTDEAATNVATGTIAAFRPLEQDGFSSYRHPALTLLVCA
jgi:hypothetical protein